MSTDVKNTNGAEKFLLGPLIVLMCTQIGTSGDNAVLSVATNSLIKTFGATMSDIQLANMVYSLCAGAFMVAGGMLGIIIGWKKNFRIGAALATIGEISLAFSSSMMMFTWGGRLLVGLGASLMIPSVLGLIVGIYKGKDQALAFGAIGSATGIASAAGPIVAGILIDNLGFRMAFGFMAIYFGSILIASFIIPDVPKSENKLKLDVVGIIIAAIGLFFFLIGISKISVWGLFKPMNAPFTILGISPAIPIALLGFLIICILVPIEKRIEEKNGCALIPSSFLTTPQVRNGIYASAITFFYLGGLIMIANPYLQVVGGFNALQTGYAMIFMGLPMFISSMLIPRKFSHVHPKTILRIGYILLGVAAIPLAFSLQPTGVSPLFYVGFAIAGTGQGFLSSQASSVVALSINQRDAEQSGGLQATARNVGQAIGVAILGMVMLFSMTSSTNNLVKENQVVSEPIKEQVAKENHVFMGDKDYQANLASMNVSKAEEKELVKINAEARIKSTRYALFTMGIISVLFIFGTNGITVYNKE